MSARLSLLGNIPDGMSKGRAVWRHTAKIDDRSRQNPAYRRSFFIVFFLICEQKNWAEDFAHFYLPDLIGGLPKEVQYTERFYRILSSALNGGNGKELLLNILAHEAPVMIKSP